MHHYTEIITHGRTFLTSRRHWWERVNITVIEFHLSVTSGSSRERTRATRLIDRDANELCYFPAPSLYGLHVLNRDVNMMQNDKQTNKQTND